MNFLAVETSDRLIIRALVQCVWFFLIAVQLWPAAKVFSQETPLAPRATIDSLNWSGVPKRVLKPQEPPTGWIRHLDAAYGITWYSPSEPRRTQKEGDPPTVVYDARDENVGFSLFCIQSDTLHQGSSKLFLDSMDEGIIRSFKRNGINAIPRPVAHVKYLNTTGRLLRIDVPGNKTSLKCDLTTPSRCYSVMAVGDHNKQLYAALERFVTTIRFTESQ
jgi:hypothetical protein